MAVPFFAKSIELVDYDGAEPQEFSFRALLLELS